MAVELAAAEAVLAGLRPYPVAITTISGDANLIHEYNAARIRRGLPTDPE